ncbi:MAG TPA: MotA/TolQ/ExbB proton channel family protein [Bacteroidales bacterium]|nr:MotA/TolQ/ExbB proton channel family protein [Bacteroidales bacterium]HOR10453.1 MotA/TolQ/ExbB proton channel family protein [Bacteroidales bacterium]HPK85088.1 MotA/TolQ/ExbB proton channel family protein [Bacteroidales bacterium]
MKRVLVFMAFAALLLIGTAQTSQAQTDQTATNQQTTEQAQAATTRQLDAQATTPAQGETVLHKEIKRLFIEGGAGFMGVILLCLIFGLAIAIERIIYLNLATTNTDKLLAKVNKALNEEGIDAAKEICRNTRGPVASIFYQGFDRAHEGVEMAEKSVISYGGVQMGLLEKNLSWISLFIAIAPMLGFLGTVIGMIQAFDAIEQAGTVSATIVAGGIKVALITTVFGLIVAIILQVFYNYLLSKIDGISNQMEDSSITLIDMLAKYNQK